VGVDEEQTRRVRGGHRTEHTGVAVLCCQQLGGTEVRCE
jgi:hypothetical protein